MYAQISSLKPAQFCKPFAGLGSTNETDNFLLFSCLTLAFSSPPCPLFRLSFYLNLSGKSGRNCLLSSILLGYNGSPNIRLSRGTTRLMSWPDEERYLRPLQSLVVSLLFLVSTLLFCGTRGALSHLNSSPHRFPWYSLRNIAPSSHSQCAFSSALQRTQPSVKLLSL